MTELRLFVADALVLAGTLVMALGIAGILRLPDVQARIHSTAKVFVLGVILVLLATVGADAGVFARGLLVGAFLFATTPVGAHALAELEWRLRRGEIPARRRLTGSRSEEDGRAEEPWHEDCTPSGAMTPVRYVVVGLGHISQAAILPAFTHTRDSRLVAIVSGDPDKRAALSKRHRLDRVHPYEDYDALLESGDIDAVYIALPNHLHCDYAVRAAERGIHVLCEKPMAVTEAECERMIRSAEAADVRLMVAKRLHFESVNLQAVAIARGGELGELRYFESAFSQDVTGDDIRLQPIEEGGGTVFDMGLYCIDAARYLFADEPIAVTARSVRREGEERFRRCDEATSAVLEFPGGKLASFTSSFSASRLAEYRLVGSRGQLLVHKAFEYDKEMSYEVFEGGERVKHQTFPPRDQFAPEIDYFSQCVLEGMTPEPDGRDGLADVRIVRAIHEAARTGRAVSVEPVPQRSRPNPELERVYPAVEKPEEIHASAPSE